MSLSNRNTIIGERKGKMGEKKNQGLGDRHDYRWARTFIVITFCAYTPSPRANEINK